MKLLEFIFKLIMRNVEVDEKDFALTRAEIQNDWDKVRTDDEAVDGVRAPKTWKYYVKKNTESPYCKLGLAVGFIFAQRWIHEFMHPTDDTEANENAGR